MKCDELKRFEIVGKYTDDETIGECYDADEVDAAFAELKQKIEDAKATAYAESVDAGMRERRLKRALWIARASTAYLEFRLFVKDSVHTADSTKADNAERMAMKWHNVGHKCRAKAEEYR